MLDAAGVNYCRYQNPAYSTSKYFYAFVDRIEYIAPKTSRLYIRTDQFMTYFDEIEPQACIVEREHVEVDGLFTHIQEENLPSADLERKYIQRLTGESMSTAFISADAGSRWWAGVKVADAKGDTIHNLYGTYINTIFFNNMPQTTAWIVCEPKKIDALVKHLSALVEDNSELLNIFDVYLFPKAMVSISSDYSHTFEASESIGADDVTSYIAFGKNTKGEISINFVDDPVIIEPISSKNEISVSLYDYALNILDSGYHNAKII